MGNNDDLLPPPRNRHEPSPTPPQFVGRPPSAVTLHSVNNQESSVQSSRKSAGGIFNPRFWSRGGQRKRGREPRARPDASAPSMPILPSYPYPYMAQHPSLGHMAIPPGMHPQGVGPTASEQQQAHLGGQYGMPAPGAYPMMEHAAAMQQMYGMPYYFPFYAHQGHAPPGYPPHVDNTQRPPQQGDVPTGQYSQQHLPHMNEHYAHVRAPPGSAMQLRAAPTSRSVTMQGQAGGRPYPNQLQHVHRAAPDTPGEAFYVHPGGAPAYVVPMFKQPNAAGEGAPRSRDQATPAQGKHGGLGDARGGDVRAHHIESPLEGEAPPDVSGSVRSLAYRLQSTQISDTKGEGKGAQGHVPAICAAPKQESAATPALSRSGTSHTIKGGTATPYASASMSRDFKSPVVVSPIIKRPQSSQQLSPPVGLGVGLLGDSPLVSGEGTDVMAKPQHAAEPNFGRMGFVSGSERYVAEELLHQVDEQSPDPSSKGREQGTRKNIFRLFSSPRKGSRVQPKGHDTYDKDEKLLKDAMQSLRMTSQLVDLLGRQERLNNSPLWSEDKQEVQRTTSLTLASLRDEHSNVTDKLSSAIQEMQRIIEEHKAQDLEFNQARPNIVRTGHARRQRRMSHLNPQARLLPAPDAHPLHSIKSHNEANSDEELQTLKQNLFPTDPPHTDDDDLIQAVGRVHRRSASSLLSGHSSSFTSPSKSKLYVEKSLISSRIPAPGSTRSSQRNDQLRSQQSEALVTSSDHPQHPAPRYGGYGRGRWS